MDLLARKKVRQRKRDDELRKTLAEEAVFRKPEKAYVPSSKKFTLVVFILLIGAIVYFYLKSEVIVTNQCGLMPGLECSNLQVADGKISFEVSNFLKEDLNITINIEGCEETATNYIKPNRKGAYEFECALGEDVVEKKIYLTYIGYSGLPHEKTGQLTAKIE
jgi:hypothetical protein